MVYHHGIKSSNKHKKHPSLLNLFSNSTINRKRDKNKFLNICTYNRKNLKYYSVSYILKRLRYSDNCKNYMYISIQCPDYQCKGAVHASMKIRNINVTKKAALLLNCLWFDNKL